MGPGTQDGSAVSSTHKGICQESKEPNPLTDLGIEGIHEEKPTEVSSDEPGEQEQHASDQRSWQHAHGADARAN